MRDIHAQTFIQKRPPHVVIPKFDEESIKNRMPFNCYLPVKSLLALKKCQRIRNDANGRMDYGKAYKHHLEAIGSKPLLG